MKLNYKTGRLPMNFIMLGYLLFALGIWRLVVADLEGIFFLAASVFLIFFRSGILIDTDKKLLKSYIGIFSLRMGKWETIEQIKGLQVVKVTESQTMSVLSVSRTETSAVYRLSLILPDRTIDLMKSTKMDIFKKAERIASFLETSLLHNAGQF